jgi:LPXTG-site transpeptidase (sortase) family protein
MAMSKRASRKKSGQSPTRSARAYQGKPAKKITRVSKKAKKGSKKPFAAVSQPIIPISQPLDNTKAPSIGQKSTFISRSIKWLHRPTTYLILGIIGFNLILVGSLYLAYRKTILSFQVAPSVVAEAHLRAAEPTQIMIPTTQIELPIIPAQIKDGIWETSETNATHLYTSARPTEGGNIVIYAHNRRNMFADLKNVKVGETINLKTEKGIYTYQVSERLVVNPNQVESVLPTDHEVLTVYTCTGPFDSKRLVLKATPIGVTSL